MKMKKTCIACIVPSILLLLSLEAALLVAAGRPSAVTIADDVGAILLPSQGKGQAGTVTVAAAKKKGEEEVERPWKCCDIGLCHLAPPLPCRCLDEVEQCAPTCKSCDPAPSDPSRRVCNDLVYGGDTGPTCTEAVAAGGNLPVALIT